MRRIASGALVLLIVLAGGLAWALSTGDTGALWVQAPTNQKNAVVNILSLELQMDPGKLQACLLKTFGDADNLKLSLHEAAKKCKENPDK